MKLGLYSGDQVCRLAKISQTQLRYWNKTAVFRPEPVEGETGPYKRAYTFRDIVGLRTVSILRNKYHAKLDNLREVERRLKRTRDTDWSNVVFYIGQGGKIYFDDPTTGTRVSIEPMGQTSLLKVVTVIRSVERELALMNRRTKRQIGKIEQSRLVMRAAPVVAGTRVPTSAIYDLYKNGFSIEQIIAEYPRLTNRDVQAAIKFQELRLAS